MLRGRVLFFLGYNGTYTLQMLPKSVHDRAKSIPNALNVVNVMKKWEVEEEIAKKQSVLIIFWPQNVFMCC